MRLTQRIKRAFKKHQPSEETQKVSVEPESLAAIVVPKKILEDKSYKTEAGLVKRDYGHYFDPCALILSVNILEAYDRTFDLTQKRDEGMTDYIFTDHDTKITYAVRPKGGAETAQEQWSNDVCVALVIEEPSLDLNTAGLFLSRVLNHHLLEYDHESEDKFTIMFHSSSGALRGTDLQRALNLWPKEAAEYNPSKGIYTHTIFDEELGW